ncbi:Y-family DNA polymerase [Atopobium fossor]|uniref:Y-family DNA polymerase n=1 Tax=Atopobium fossor TaxID=39487 RepID=UPI00041D0D78|nr:Y-family DNA polymerase [Atopobium fossor]
MEQPQKTYLCIDLKSFYASVECLERGLDPFTTNLVVADPTRTAKTICLAVSPAMKALGVPGRCRVFEIPKHIHYIMAPPRMSLYIKRSAEVYGVYLKWIAKEDIFVYSIDEAFFDITGYLSMYGMTARELGEAIRADVAHTLGITATCGMGPNLYLAKIALDISAKHRPDFFGELTEQSYRETLWHHMPLTDFWRIGPGISRRLAAMGIHTMGQLAAAPTEPLYQEFGIDAEILIDHAWGIEPTTMAHIKNYKPRTQSFSTAQVFSHDYTPQDALIVCKEMADQLALQLVEQHKQASGISLYIGYAASKDERELIKKSIALHQRLGPSSTGSYSFVVPTSSSSHIRKMVTRLFADKCLTNRRIHRIGLAASNVIDEQASGTQFDLLADTQQLSEEHAMSQTVNDVKKKFGKNALLRGIDLLPQATARERNLQIGGHRSGEEG